MDQIIEKPLPVEIQQSVRQLGERIRTARLRRQLSTEELAQACGIGRRTLYRIENGEPGVAVGTLLAVLWKLGLLDTVRTVADPDTDEHGKILEAARRPQRVRASAPNNDF
ncbi:MAG: helix-turn-helix domain-containing protein [Azonexus sp.]|jgi:transcriptional regulator with XRE-family HTH domain|nr:helix-turn-helix domain-containing protein [Azonexus sp.]